jgi:hypothetical protein
MNRQLLRALWASPATLLGLAVVILSGSLRNGRCAVVDGVLEAHGPVLRWALAHLTLMGTVSAMTLGHVVVGVDRAALERTREHERVHVGQYERWGPLFVPAYLIASVWAMARGGHAYFDNPFEREAFEHERRGGVVSQARVEKLMRTGRSSSSGRRAAAQEPPEAI